MALLSEVLYFLLLCAIALAQKDGDVRLENGDTYLEGRVEIFHNGVWGTVCDDRFGEEEGQVVCNSLGHGALKTTFPRSAYGQGTGMIWMDELVCSGDEKSLTECRFGGWGAHDCSHAEDVGVECNPKSVPVPFGELPLRISCPPDTDATCNACPSSVHDPCVFQSVVKGILEAHYEGEWYPVDGEGWGTEETRVACGQLGYSAHWTPPSLDQLWKDWDAAPSNCSTRGCDAASSNCSTRGCDAASSNCSTSDCDAVSSNCSTSGCDESENYRDHLKIVVLKGPVCTGSEQTLLNCSFAGVGVQNFSGDPLTTKSVATVECGHRPPRNEECYTGSHEVNMRCVCVCVCVFDFANYLSYPHPPLTSLHCARGQIMPDQSK